MSFETKAEQEITRRIELKLQLIKITQAEIAELEGLLKGKRVEDGRKQTEKSRPGIS